MVAVQPVGAEVSSSVSSGQQPNPVSGLTASDQVAHFEATRTFEAKRATEARQRAKPLFDRYPDS